MDSNGKELPVKFFINGNLIFGAKFYLASKRSSYLLQLKDDKIILPDSLGPYDRIILIYNGYHTALPILPDNASNLEIYYDNRIFHNLANKVSGGDWFRLKYIFRKKYLVSFGNGYGGICFQNNRNYLRKRYNIKI
jgi:hypothetical protein